MWRLQIILGDAKKLCRVNHNKGGTDFFHLNYFVNNVGWSSNCGPLVLSNPSTSLSFLIGKSVMHQEITLCCIAKIRYQRWEGIGVPYWQKLCSLQRLKEKNFSLPFPGSSHCPHSSAHGPISLFSKSAALKWVMLTLKSLAFTLFYLPFPRLTIFVIALSSPR